MNNHYFWSLAFFGKKYFFILTNGFKKMLKKLKIKKMLKENFKNF